MNSVHNLSIEPHRMDSVALKALAGEYIYLKTIAEGTFHVFFTQFSNKFNLKITM